MRRILSIAIVLVAQGFVFAQEEQVSEIEQQNAAFKRWWGQDLNWKFDDLPLEGEVPEWRTPYSGHDYPDRQGGTAWALRLYDAAFRNGGRAVTWEDWDTTAYKERRGGREPRGFLGRLFAGRPRTPAWHGHCNGWTAASIRHAEPEHSVVRNGVTFSPAHIKGLLAEVYMYQDIEYLGGDDESIDPAIFHVVLTNWLGRGGHPIGVDTTVGKEVWNYPIYSYKATSHKHTDSRVEVSINVVYANSTRQEFDEGPQLAKQLYMHYQLELDNAGNIRRGSFYRDSAQIDILWAPLAPVQAGKPGNERGNPHIDVDEILAIWRASVSDETRKKWLNINPTKEDAVEIESDETPAPTQEGVEVADASAAAVPAEGASTETPEPGSSATETPKPETPDPETSETPDPETPEPESSDPTASLEGISTE